MIITNENKATASKDLALRAEKVIKEIIKRSFLVQANDKQKGLYAVGDFDKIADEVFNNGFIQDFDGTRYNIHNQELVSIENGKEVLTRVVAFVDDNTKQWYYTDNVA